MFLLNILEAVLVYDLVKTRFIKEKEVILNGSTNALSRGIQLIGSGYLQKVIKGVNWLLSPINCAFIPWLRGHWTFVVHWFSSVNYLLLHKSSAAVRKKKKELRCSCIRQHKVHMLPVKTRIRLRGCAHPRSLIRVFARHSVDSQGSQSVFRQTPKTLIRLRGCAVKE